MAYLTVIPLADAKAYLGVDDTSRDAEITRMINAALSYIEKETNIIMVVGDKTYRLKDGCARIYDSPINTLDSELASTVTREYFTNYSVYTDTNAANKTLTLNVGSTTVDPELVEAGYQIIDYFFHNKEGDKTNIPESARLIIDKNRRFLL